MITLGESVFSYGERLSCRWPQALHMLANKITLTVDEFADPLDEPAFLNHFARLVISGLCELYDQDAAD